MNSSRRVQGGLRHAPCGPGDGGPPTHWASASTPPCQMRPQTPNPPKDITPLSVLWELSSETLSTRTVWLP